MNINSIGRQNFSGNITLKPDKNDSKIVIVNKENNNGIHSLLTTSALGLTYVAKHPGKTALKVLFGVPFLGPLAPIVSVGAAAYGVTKVYQAGNDIIKKENTIMNNLSNIAKGAIITGLAVYTGKDALKLAKKICNKELSGLVINQNRIKAFGQCIKISPKLLKMAYKTAVSYIIKSAQALGKVKNWISKAGHYCFVEPYKKTVNGSKWVYGKITSIFSKKAPKVTEQALRQAA